MADRPRIYTPPRLAAEWHCKPQAVRDLLEAGLLPGFKIGKKHWRITLSAVEAYERGERLSPIHAKTRRRPRAREVQDIDGPF